MIEVIKYATTADGRKCKFWRCNHVIWITLPKSIIMIYAVTRASKAAKRG